MIALLLAWLGGFTAARCVRNLWLAVVSAAIAGVLSAVCGTALKYLFAGSAFSEKELALGLVLGAVGYPMVAVGALWFYWKRKPPDTEQALTSLRPKLMSRLQALRARPLNGWTRVAVALSCFWLLGVAFFGYRAVSQLLEEKSYRIAHHGTPVTTFVFSAAQPEAEVTELINNTLIPEVAENVEAFKDRVIRDKYESYVNSRRDRLVRNYVELALVPVLALVIALFLAGWVRRGFASSVQT